MRLAVIVPTLDEEPSLRRSLPAALAQCDELVVSDGGSRDRTVAVARELGARVVAGGAGRGPQLNRGAAAVSAEVMLFLHADTVLPRDARRRVEEAIRCGAAGGGFQVRFDSESPLMRFGSRVVNLRTRWLRVPLGDQAQFVTAEAFRRLGGFRDWPILEDLDLILRLRRVGPVAVVEATVATSARRFEQRGRLRTVATNWLIWLLFLVGVSPHRLAGLYRKVR